MPARVALISIKPEFVEKILTGKKILEFRRSWAASPVDKLVIYSSSPTQRIVAYAKVSAVHKGSAASLWNLSRTKSGGITRKRLFEYFHGKAQVFAIELGEITLFESAIDPKAIFENFRPPQSFRYLREHELTTLGLR